MYVFVIPYLPGTENIRVITRCPCSSSTHISPISNLQAWTSLDRGSTNPQGFTAVSLTTPGIARGRGRQANILLNKSRTWYAKTELCGIL